MTLTQILQKIREAFYTKKEIDSMGGGASLSDTISQKADKSDLSNYLPLSGGAMTGNIYKTVSTGSLTISGGSTDKGGASILLFGKDRESAVSGRFDISANGSTSSLTLRGLPNGALTWDGKQLAYAYSNTVTLGHMHVGGTLTSSNKGVYFVIPINVYGIPSITLSRLRIRCNGNYLFGSSGSIELPTQSYSMSTDVYYGCIAFNLTFENAESVNNEAVAVEVKIKLTY